MMKLVVLGLFVLVTRGVTGIAYRERTSTAGIMEVDNPLSSREIDVTVTSTSKKRDAESGLADSVEVTLDVEGEQVTKRFTRSPEQDDVKLYDVVGDDIVLDEKYEGKRDWATYTSDNGQGAILVTRDADNKLTTEGSIIHNGEHFFVQPAAHSGRHVMHRLTTKRDAALEEPKIVNKRSRSKYVVELAWVMDPKAFQKCKTHAKKLKMKRKEFILKHLSLIMAGVNERFKSLSTDITVKSLGVMVMKKTSPYESKVITKQGNFNGNRMIDSFNKWVNGRKTLKADAVQLLTGYEFLDTRTKGLAKASGTCSNRNVGIAVYSMGLSMAVVVAHELGHALGMRHDETNGCGSSKDYVMSANSDSRFRISEVNRWKFTSCSNSDLVAFINKLGKKSKVEACLETSVAAITDIKNKKLPRVNKGKWNVLKSWDSQCAFIRPGSAFCPNAHRRRKNLRVSQICLGIFCGDESKNDCRTYVPYDNTQCGNYEVCKNGKCVKDRILGQEMDTNCPYPDTKNLFYKVNRVLVGCDYAKQNKNGQIKICGKKYVAGPCCRACAD